MDDKNPFEAFIDSRYDSEELKHIGNNAGSLRIVLRPDVHAALERLSNAARQSIQEAIQRQLDDPNNAKFADQVRNVFNTGKLRGFSVGFTTPLTNAGYEAMRDAINVERLERLRRMYGDEWVNEAQQLAETSGIPFEQAVTYCQMRDRINWSQLNISSALAAFAEIAKAFGAGIAEQMQEGVTDQDFEPSNRHTRRAGKHAKRVKEGDQAWKANRRYRNRH